MDTSTKIFLRPKVDSARAWMTPKARRKLNVIVRKPSEIRLENS